MPGKTLVVDACVGASAGHKDEFPLSKWSRETLNAIRNNHDHKMAFSSALMKEWSDHESSFGKKIRVEMMRTGRVVIVNDEAWKKLKGRCSRTLKLDLKIASFEKDFHLISAALETDETIVTNEVVLVDHLIELRSRHHEICNLAFGNPGVEQQTCVDWVEAGAQQEHHRLVVNLTA